MPLSYQPPSNIHVLYWDTLTLALYCVYYMICYCSKQYEIPASMPRLVIILGFLAGRTSITRSACQANILQLSCPQHSHIRITQDFYGQSAQCVYSAGDCVYDFTDFHQCSGLQACNVTVQQVHNPYCPETDISYYQVIYTCIPGKSDFNSVYGVLLKHSRLWIYKTYKEYKLSDISRF